LYIILKNVGGSPTAGSSVLVTFAITGTDAKYYNTIPSVTLTFVSNSSYQTIPVATSIAVPTLSANTATFKLQCNQASTIYWGLGIYPSILNTLALDFQARIISKGNGLTSNFT
jgi:L-cystine uptake protein TcyP (sodium:dicarboxylate symporter family)